MAFPRRALRKEADERLLVEAAQADPSRFAELYESHFARVYAFIARRVRNRQEAEDLTSEVFRQALQDLKRFEWRGVPFAAWLLRIAANAMADRWQRVARDQGEPPPEPPDVAATEDIERRAFHTLNLYLVVRGAAEVLEFARQAFGVQEMLRVKRPDGSIMHAEFRVGDSMIEIGESNEQYPPLPATIYLKVDDVDAVYERALQAGGVSLYPPTDKEYGERDGGVKDASGNHWYIGSPRGQTHFLPDQTPDGFVHHAKMRIGDSVLEMGEAHGPFPAMPLNLHLYVPDADAVYRQALAAGATSVREPVD